MKEKPTPQELSESQFTATLNQAEVSWRSKLDEALVNLNEIISLKNAHITALHDGLRVKYWDNNGYLSMDAHPKEQAGFQIPRRSNGESC